MHQLNHMPTDSVTMTHSCWWKVTAKMLLKNCVKMTKFNTDRERVRVCVCAREEEKKSFANEEGAFFLSGVFFLLECD